MVWKGVKKAGILIKTQSKIDTRKKTILPSEKFIEQYEKCAFLLKVEKIKEKAENVKKDLEV